MSNCCPPTVPGAEQPKLPAVEFCVLNSKLSYKDGRLIKIPVSNPIADGIYPNATITVQGGCITAIAPGANVVYSACDPCDGPTPPPPDPTDVVLDGSSCNLLSQSGAGLLGTLITSPSSCINLIGCGSAAQPLQAVPIISPDPGNALECRPSGMFVPSPGATVGVNYVGCGLTITNGLITAIPLPFEPVLELFNDDGTMVIDRDVNNPCRVRLRATTVGTPSIPGVSLGIGNVPTPAGLPDPISTFWLAAVGNANPRALWGYLTGVGWREIFDSNGLSLQVNL